jgi:hypothetical protein
MAKAVNSFLFANKRASGVSVGAHNQREAARAVEELRVRSDGEWQRTETQARDMLSSISAERIMQAEALEDVDKVARRQNLELAAKEAEGMEAELQQALVQEREYQRCPYRRTGCKALEHLINRYNTPRNWKRIVNNERHSSGKWLERGSNQKFRFDQYGAVKQTYELLVDPGRFWSYDLLRSYDYGERPL